ncbi:MAG: ribosomal-protein-alanine N-acetyltransferase [Gemmatimonadetes bacterium]|nr:ribosomal-protein-alanine N-acetyltransferase [Gemmatimonadota bacterium]
MTAPVTLRLMHGADVAEVQRIERLSYSVPWSELTFRGLLQRQDAELLVAELDGRLAGYAVYWQVLDQGELGNVAVDPVWRRRGVARRLVVAVMERAAERGVRELFLEVRPSNAGARQLYESLGFARVGQRRNYYQEPAEDALVMRVFLMPDPTPPDGGAAADGSGR